MLREGEAIDNETLCRLFGVGNTGGIRVNTAKNLIVLVSNNTDASYTNTWINGVLHFVGRGASGAQKLTRQNRTLANSKRSGSLIHLFEVFEKGRYVYSGIVELSADPFLSDQPDRSGEDRLIWVFPLRKTTSISVDGAALRTTPHLPHGVYATINISCRRDKISEVNQHLDELRRLGVEVVDQRDVDEALYQQQLARWNQRVLEELRRAARKIIGEERLRAKQSGRAFGYADDEVDLDVNSGEDRVREVLSFIGQEDRFKELIERARQQFTMPDPPDSILSETDIVEEVEVVEPRFNVARFNDIT